MGDPIFGSKYGPQNGVQNWITFSFLLLGLCLGPRFGVQIWTQKWGQPSENFAAARPQRFCKQICDALAEHERKC